MNWLLFISWGLVCFLAGLSTAALSATSAWQTQSEDMGYRLMCWRNAFSSPDAPRALFWLGELTRLGEVHERFDVVDDAGQDNDTGQPLVS